MPGSETAILEQDPQVERVYQDAIARAKITLFLVLGSIYIAAVVLLESAIMPLYVYRPLRRMLEADTATRAGDRQQRADSRQRNPGRRDRPDHAVAQRYGGRTPEAGR